HAGRRCLPRCVRGGVRCRRAVAARAGARRRRRRTGLHARRRASVATRRHSDRAARAAGRIDDLDFAGMIAMLVRNIFAALLLLCAVAAPARADIDYSDIWYEGALRSGWGVNLAQNDNAIFATFFVYDVNKNPTWFGG